MLNNVVCESNFVETLNSFAANVQIFTHCVYFILATLLLKSMKFVFFISCHKIAFYVFYSTNKTSTVNDRFTTAGTYLIFMI